jgi:hypothetical protein
MAAAALDRALALNPNAAHAWNSRGSIHALRNEPEAAIEAIEAIERARRLSPFDPFTLFYAANIAIAHLAARRFEQAIEWADRASHDQPRMVVAMRVKVAANAHLGRLDEARAELGRVLAMTLERRSPVFARTSLVQPRPNSSTWLPPACAWPACRRDSAGRPQPSRARQEARPARRGAASDCPRSHARRGQAMICCRSGTLRGVAASMRATCASASPMIRAAARRPRQNNVPVEFGTALARSDGGDHLGGLARVPQQAFGSRCKDGLARTFDARLQIRIAHGDVSRGSSANTVEKPIAIVDRLHVESGKSLP